MIDLKHSLVIEATEDPNFFSFYSPDLEGFSGVGHSIEDCLYKAKWGYGRAPGDNEGVGAESSSPERGCHGDHQERRTGKGGGVTVSVGSASRSSPVRTRYSSRNHREIWEL